jgi:uncharacterized membrane protein YedE/YeeE
MPFVGFVGGIVLGLAARLGRFCTLGAIEDAVFGAGMRRLRIWGLSIGAAMIGVAFLTLTGVFDPVDSFYLSRPVPLISTLLGGLSFGLGMALVGTCGFGCLARLGGGDLSGLVVFLVIGVTGYVASSGIIGVIRVAILPEREVNTEVSGLAHGISAFVGLPMPVVLLFVASVLAMLAWSLTWRDRLCGLAVGIVVAVGWAVTSWQSGQDFGETVARSYNFVRPLGDTMIYAMTSSGTALTFGVAGVAGTVTGATLGALWLGEFRWEACDDARTLKRQIIGASLMGIGGVFAMGCTVGQGISAASLMATSAPVFLLAMFIGAWFGLQWLVRGSVVAPLREALHLE